MISSHAAWPRDVEPERRTEPAAGHKADTKRTQSGHLSHGHLIGGLVAKFVSGPARRLASNRFRAASESTLSRSDLLGPARLHASS